MPKAQVFVAISVVLCALMGVGCTRAIEGHGVSIYDDPFQVAGLPTTGGPNGPRTGVADSPLTATNGDGGEVDKLALNAIDDIQSYWQAGFGAEFPGETFAPVEKLISWNARAAAARRSSSARKPPTTWSMPPTAAATTPSAGTARCCCPP